MTDEHPHCSYAGLQKGCSSGDGGDGGTKEKGRREREDGEDNSRRV